MNDLDIGCRTVRFVPIWRTAFTTRHQASKAIVQYIEGFYTPPRRHSSLGYVSPVTFEAAIPASKLEERLARH
jgi:putative transposase